MKLITFLGGFIRKLLRTEPWITRKIARKKSTETRRIILASLGWIAVFLVILLVLVVGPYDLTFRIIEVALASVAGFFWVSYYLLSRNAYVEPQKGSYDHTPNFKASQLIEAVASAEVSKLQAYAYLDAVDSQSRSISRISETVEQFTRVLMIRTSVTIRLPQPAESAQLIVPLILQRRGQLIDSLEVSDGGGKRISTVSQREAIVVALRVMRWLILQAGGEASEAYRDTLEVQVADLFSSHVPTLPEDSLPLIALIDKLPIDPSRRHDLAMAKRIVGALAQRYAICVLATTLVPARPVTACDSDLPDAISEVRFGFQRREIVRLVWQANSTTSNIRDTVRGVLGIRPSTTQFPLFNAARADSYHLQIFGREGTYLSRQSLVDSKSGASVMIGQYALRPRYGQRYSHLYLRNSFRGSEQFFENTFFERPPGSIAVATLSAAACTVLVSLVGLSALGLASMPFSGAVTALLAIPAAIGAWSGLEQSKSLSGGTLAARVSNLSTIGIAFLAIAQYTIVEQTAPDSPLAVAERSGSNSWIALALLATVNVAVAAGSWSIRTATYRTFSKKGQLEPY